MAEIDSTALSRPMPMRARLLATSAAVMAMTPSATFHAPVNAASLRAWVSGAFRSVVRVVMAARSWLGSGLGDGQQHGQSGVEGQPGPHGQSEQSHRRCMVTSFHVGQEPGSSREADSATCALINAFEIPTPEV